MLADDIYGILHVKREKIALASIISSSFTSSRKGIPMNLQYLSITHYFIKVAVPSPKQIKTSQKLVSQLSQVPNLPSGNKLWTYKVPVDMEPPNVCSCAIYRAFDINAHVQPCTMNCASPSFLLNDKSSCPKSQSIQNITKLPVPSPKSQTLRTNAKTLVPNPKFLLHHHLSHLAGPPCGVAHRNVVARVAAWGCGTPSGGWCAGPCGRQVSRS